MNPNLKAAAISEYIGKAVRAMQEKKKKEKSDTEQPSKSNLSDPDKCDVLTKDQICARKFAKRDQLKQQQEDRKKGKYPIF